MTKLNSFFISVRQFFAKLFSKCKKPKQKKQNRQRENKPDQNVTNGRKIINLKFQAKIYPKQEQEKLPQQPENKQASKQVSFNLDEINDEAEKIPSNQKIISDDLVVHQSMEQEGGNQENQPNQKTPRIDRQSYRQEIQKSIMDISQIKIKVDPKQIGDGSGSKMSKFKEQQNNQFKINEMIEEKPKQNKVLEPEKGFPREWISDQEFQIVRSEVENEDISKDLNQMNSQSYSIEKVGEIYYGDIKRQSTGIHIKSGLGIQILNEIDETHSIKWKVYKGHFENNKKNGQCTINFGKTLDKSEIAEFKDDEKIRSIQKFNRDGTELKEEIQGMKSTKSKIVIVSVVNEQTNVETKLDVVSQKQNVPKQVDQVWFRYGSTFNAGDEQILLRNGWISNSIINAFVVSWNTECEKRFWSSCSIDRMYAFDSHFWIDLEKTRKVKKEHFLDGKLDVCDRLFFVINQNQSHWFLAEVNKTSNKMIIYDSMRKDQSNHYYGQVQALLTAQVFKRLQMKLVVHSQCAQQQNGYDCGVFVCCFLQQILEKQSLNFGSQEAIQMRKTTLMALVKRQ